MHRNAVLTLVFCSLLWSISGIVTRQLEHAGGFEAVLGRSLFAALTVIVWLVIERGPNLWREIRRMGRVGLFSGVMWSIMMTCFMFALLLTTVAKAMVLLAVTPLLAALLAWVLLGERLPLRTWLAILVAGLGIVWMASDAFVHDPRFPNAGLGMLIAVGVPLAASLNIIVIKQRQASVDLKPALLVGALISVAVTLPFALPIESSAADIGWLAMLGVFQIALPGLLFIRVSPHLSSGEVGLLVLLEVVFAPLWVWIGAGETPTQATLVGGGVVIVVLVLNELMSGRFMVPPRG